MSNLDDTVRTIVLEHARLARPDVADTDDLYDAGMTSHTSVNVMLAVEDHFDVEFPEALLRRETFQSIATISAAVAQFVEVDA